MTGDSAYESAFSGARPGTTESRIWNELLSPNAERLLPCSESEKLARFLEDEERGVMLVNPLQLQYWIRDHPDVGCRLEFVRSFKTLFAYPARKGFPYLKVSLKAPSLN